MRDVSWAHGNKGNYRGRWVPHSCPERSRRVSRALCARSGDFDFPQNVSRHQPRSGERMQPTPQGVGFATKKRGAKEPHRKLTTAASRPDTLTQSKSGETRFMKTLTGLCVALLLNAAAAFAQNTPPP